ncbi:MAG: hypothetical protein IJS32_04615 [Kiritimatiellae bacterium]|nr:hypothetical protein [Kiritimatiellia bacterium]
MKSFLSSRCNLLSFLLFALALCAVVFVVWRQNDYPVTGIDDANIFFSYAENLAHGRGFVYANNPEPVEGFTSMLWTLLCAVCFAIRVNETGVFVLSMFFLLGTQYICWKLLDRILEEKGIRPRFPKAFYAVGILSSAGYATWMGITLMDVALWGFFLAWFAWLFFSSCRESGVPSPARLAARAVPFALAPLVRPEFMAAVPAMLGLLFLRNLLLKRPIRHVFAWGGIFLASLGVLAAFRLRYFGWPLPNTFYAKVSPSLFYNLDKGILYALSFFTSSVFGILFCASVAGWSVTLLLPSPQRRLLPSSGHAPATAADMFLLWVVLLCGLPVLVGGDHFAYARFYQPVYPLICLGLVIAVPAGTWDAIPEKTGKTFSAIALWALLPLGWNYSTSYLRSHWERQPAAHEFGLAANGTTEGKMFNDVFADASRLPNVGVITAGGIARTYAGPLTDLMGLNNTTVAHFPGKREGLKNHAAFELAVFPALPVDVLPFSATNAFADNVLKGLFETPDFVAGWRCGRLENRANGTTADLCVRQSYLDSLLSSPAYGFRDTERWNGTAWVDIPPGD